MPRETEGSPNFIKHDYGRRPVRLLVPEQQLLFVLSIPGISDNEQVIVSMDRIRPDLSDQGNYLVDVEIHGRNVRLKFPL